MSITRKQAIGLVLLLAALIAALRGDLDGAVRGLLEAIDTIEDPTPVPPTPTPGAELVS